MATRARSGKSGVPERDRQGGADIGRVAFQRGGGTEYEEMEKANAGITVAWKMLSPDDFGRF